MFQSLFSWIWTQWSSCDIRYKVYVSILVFLDLNRLSYEESDFANVVSILVFLDLNWDKYEEEEISYKVSILVFLDLNLRCMIVGFDEVACFNPCFLGFELSLYSLAYQQRHWVSILVFLDLNRWKNYLKYAKRQRFNPCFLGFERIQRRHVL